MRTAKRVSSNNAPAANDKPISLDWARKYKTLFEQASDAICTVKANGTFDSVNQALEELTGYLKSELKGQPVSLLAPQNQHRVPERARVMEPALFLRQGTHEDVVLLTKDGLTKMVDVSVRHVVTGKLKLSLVLLRDVTEKKRMERELITKHAELRNAYTELERSNVELKTMQESLVQAGKLAALGELAAGVAHELNQPLQGIRGYAQEIQSIQTQGSLDSDTLKTFLAEIVGNADKMARIIQHLRTFTRQSVEELRPVNLHSVIEEALKMLGRQFQARGITVVREFSTELPTCFANPNQLEQVFINLATNARDAIEETRRGRGTVTIRTRLVDTRFLEVQFCDDGVGMPGSVKDKAFNPFFTTKEVGKGMGLGLSLSYGILNKIHGTMRVESEVGKGTCFAIRIPIDFREVVV